MASGLYEAEVRTLMASARDVIRDRAGVLLRLALVGGALSWLLTRMDATVNRLVASMDSRPLMALARVASFFGDFATLVLPAMILLWFSGYSVRRRLWRLTAWSGLIAAVLAGLSANVVKNAADRVASDPERSGPMARVAGRIHHTSVSAQTATIFGAAAALAAAVPPARVPAMGVAVLVAWSRVQLQRHNPSGVALGAAIGIWIGLLFGMAARRAAGRPDVPAPVRAFDRVVDRVRGAALNAAHGASRRRFARRYVEVKAPRSRPSPPRGDR